VFDFDSPQRTQRPGSAAAIELAKQYPDVRWGAVEVREILFFDPV